MKTFFQAKIGKEIFQNKFFGPHFQRAVKRELEVFQANVANGAGEISNLTGSTQILAPNMIYTY